MGTIPDPSYSVRFYIRPTSKEPRVNPTPLRMKVWIGAQKGFIYLSTDVLITPAQWSAFSTNGQPNVGADPHIAAEVDTWKAAAQLVLSSAVVNNTISEITSEYFKRRVTGVVGRMRANRESGAKQPIIVGASPLEVKVCAGCDFCAEKCRADIYEAERDVAAEFAAYNGFCRWRKEQGVEVCRPGATPTDQYSHMSQLERIVANGIKFTINGEKGGEA